MRDVLVALTLAGCALGRESFERDFVEAWCRRDRACDVSSIADSGSVCEVGLIERQQGVGACLSRVCTFDRTAADACIDALRTDCAEFEAGDWVAACDAVWKDCTDPGRARACRAVR